MKRWRLRDSIGGPLKSGTPCLDLRNAIPQERQWCCVGVWYQIYVQPSVRNPQRESDDEVAAADITDINVVAAETNRLMLDAVSMLRCAEAA